MIMESDQKATVYVITTASGIKTMKPVYVMMAIHQSLKIMMKRHLFQEVANQQLMNMVVTIHLMMKQIYMNIAELHVAVVNLLPEFQKLLVKKGLGCTAQKPVIYVVQMM